MASGHYKQGFFQRIIPALRFTGVLGSGLLEDVNELAGRTTGGEIPFSSSAAAELSVLTKRNSTRAALVISTKGWQRAAMGYDQYNIELLFKALADRTRLRLINLIGNEEICVCFLVEVLSINQPKVSRHLAYLRRAKVVASRREGKWMHYRMAAPPDAHAASILHDVRFVLGNDQEMQRDRSRLIQICGAPNLPSPLRKAPRPAHLSAD
jgi:ArsR family transcriptional regulator